MRKKLFVAVIAVIVSALAFPAAGRDLKILYWNIQNGMWSDQGNNYDNFVDFVKSEDPDICVWCEAESRYFTDSGDRIENCEDAYLPWNWDILAKRYGHNYVLVSGKRDTFPQVITSKYPIRIVKRVNGNGDDVIVVHGAGVAQVEVGNKTLNIVTIHSWPYKYTYMADDKKASTERKEGAMFRAKEMEYICQQTISVICVNLYLSDIFLIGSMFRYLPFRINDTGSLNLRQIEHVDAVRTMNGNTSSSGDKTYNFVPWDRRTTL